MNRVGGADSDCDCGVLPEVFVGAADKGCDCGLLPIGAGDIVGAVAGKDDGVAQLGGTG
jgi:hypothetical protein